MFCGGFPGPNVILKILHDIFCFTKIEILGKSAPHGYPAFLLLKRLARRVIGRRRAAMRG